LIGLGEGDEVHVVGQKELADQQKDFFWQVIQGHRSDFQRFFSQINNLKPSNSTKRLLDASTTKLNSLQVLFYCEGSG
jgi:hypothetical protein